MTTTVAEVAANLNENAATITIDESYWNTLLESGYIVKLKIGGDRCTRQLTPEETWGTHIPTADRDAICRVVSLPMRYLVPERIVKAMKRLDSRARELLKERPNGQRSRYAIGTMWGAFVPEKSYKEWRAADQECEAAYMALAQQIRDEWDDMQREVRRDYAILGRSKYAELRKAIIAGDIAGEIPDEQEWVAAFVNRLSLPTSADAIADSFYWERQVRYLELSALIAAQEKARLSAEIEAADDLARTAARDAAGGVQSFAQQIISDIRTRVYDAVSDSLEAFQANGDRLPRNSTKQLSNLIESVERLKFFKDDDLDRELARLATLVDTPSDKRDSDEVRAVLTDLGVEARLTLAALNVPIKRSARKGTIPDDLPEIVQAAQRRTATVATLDDDLDVTVVGRRRRAPIQDDLDLAV